MKPRPLIAICLRPSATGLTSAKFQGHYQLFNHLTPLIAVALQCRQLHSNNHKRHLNPPSIPRIPHRLASTSAAATAKKPLPRSTRVPVPSTTRPPQVEQNPKLNPPLTSYAPHLELPPRAEGQSYVGYLWKCGRAYIAFYKEGISNVRSTSKLAKTLRAKAKEKSGETSLSRAEWQLVRRNRRDMWRLPAFGLLVLLMGEWVPFIALYITPLIPEPCRFPKQVDRDTRKAEEKRVARANRMVIYAARNREPGASLQSQVQGAAPALSAAAVDKMDYVTLMTYAGRLDAYPKLLDWLPMSPPKGMVAWGLKKKLEYLETDDKMIIRDGGWQGLGSLEIKRACFERGINVLDKGEREMRMQLAKWYGPEGKGMAAWTAKK